jgi:UDP-N-acetylmuramoylalanine--D-glutamate ligase
MITDWKNKKVAVLGLGVEGLATVQFLQNKGSEIWVLDKKKKEEFADEIVKSAEELGAKFVLGPEYLKKLSEYDVIVRAPGFIRKSPELLKAEKEGAVITSLTKIFFDLCPCPIIGVTGTKGKGTTSALIYEMLKDSGRDVYLGGNIGTPPLDFLDKLTKQSIVVLELSSFQLQDLTKSPYIAVMLMTTSEHLDHHKDVAEYIDAKRNILRFQDEKDFAVLNRDYIVTNESDIFTEGNVFYVTRERDSVEQGAFIRDNAVWMRMQGSEWKIIDTQNILLPGRHNLENVEAAVVAATLGGADKGSIAHVLRTFKGLEHRLELVREVKGVRYYDDSFSTTPETAIAAIEAFGAPEILILGGSSKNSDFTELGNVISEAKNIKAIIGIGEEWWKIKSALRTKNKEQRILFVEDAKDMRTIVLAASKIAQPGDVVLLSPACASFGMFRNYKDRGEQFKKEVNSLK